MGSRGTRTTNTSAEVLKSILQDLALLKTYPDANLEFIGGVEMMIVNELRAPVDQLMAEQGLSGAGPQMNEGGPMMAPLGPPPEAQGPGVPGLRQEAAMPPVDELRRLLGGAR